LNAVSSPPYSLKGSCYEFATLRPWHWSTVTYELYVLRRESFHRNANQEIYFFSLIVRGGFAISRRNNQYPSTFRLRRIGLESLHCPHPRSEDTGIKLSLNLYVELSHCVGSPLAFKPLKSLHLFTSSSLFLPPWPDFSK
jgi:hypothetical protein